MTMVALGWTIALRYIAKTKRNPTVPLPHWIDDILAGLVGTLLCLNPRPRSNTTDHPRNSDNGRSTENADDDNDQLVDKEIFYRSDWGWFANILDRFVFLIYLIVYFCFIVTF